MPSIAYLDFKYERTSTVNKLYDNAFTITALVDDCQIGFYYSRNNTTVSFSISYDNGMTWTEISLPDESNFYYPDTIDTGETIMIVGNENLTFPSLYGFHIFSEEDNYFNVSGDLLTLIDSNEASIINNGISSLSQVFYGLFGNFEVSGTNYVSYVVDASNLVFPNITPSQYCYTNMFYNCPSLEKAPTILPATTLSRSCYQGIFKGCTSLVTTPILPATTLQQDCYNSMFANCYALTVAPELPATTLARYCYDSMFMNCRHLVVAPRLSATSLQRYCYEYMFEGCIRLTNAPELPATTLEQNCYQGMFKGCTSLTTAPELPATTLVGSCYKEMFQNCTSLNYIKILAQGSNLDSYLYTWVDNVAPTGTFVKDINATYQIDSANGVPVGWTVYDVGESIPQNYTVTLHVNPNDAGSIMGNPIGTNTYVGTFQENTNVTITASPDEGYLFDGWYNGNTLISAETSYSFIINSNVEYTAKFYSEQDIRYNIFVQQNVDVDPAPTGGGTYAANASCTITAYDHTNFRFLGWSLDGGPIFTTEHSFTFNVNSSFTYIAIYEYVPQTILYTVSLYTNNETMGYCTGAGRYEQGTLATIQAVPNTGYDFVRWKDENGLLYSTDRTISMNITEDITLFAEFEPADSYTHQYFTIQAIDDNLQVVLSAFNYYNSSTMNFNVWYQKNNESWSHINFDYSQDDPITGWMYSRTICVLRANETVKIHTDAHTLNLSSMPLACNISVFNQNEPNPSNPNWMHQYKARFNVYGNILSLIDYSASDILGPNYGNPDYPTFSDITLEPYVFRSLLSNSDVVSVSNLRLPATTLTEYCYASMFNNCTSLTTIPALPATTLASNCYKEMFYNCTSLVEAPELPATTLADYCYNRMFYECANLVYYPELPATTLGTHCYEEMFMGCYALTTGPSLIATTLTDWCYYGMFSNCTSLVEAPELPATILTEYCYAWMFNGCTSLVEAPELPATTLADWCYAGMFNGCDSLTTAPELPATTLASNCYKNMFCYCDSLTTAPELPAPIVGSTCYSYMFQYCVHLNYVKCLATELQFASTVSWLDGVSSTGTFIKDANMDGWTEGVDGIPTGWTVQNAS